MLPNTDISNSESLREEIIASEKARIDLLKYKLIAIAGIGAVGLGFGGYSGSKADLPVDPLLMLAVIPFVCVYVDLLCWHNTLRILVIGRYLAHYGDCYENYLKKIGDKVQSKKGAGYFFELEDTALHLSTIAVSFLIFCYGMINYYFPSLLYSSGQIDNFTIAFLSLSGILGLL